MRLISFTLRRRGYTVIEANAGDRALEIIRSELPDLAVLDIMMPGLSGIEVAQAMANDPLTADIPILMLSAKGQAAEIELGLASGASAYMVKPVNFRGLSEVAPQLNLSWVLLRSTGRIAV